MSKDNIIGGFSYLKNFDIFIGVIFYNKVRFISYTIFLFFN